MKRVVRKDVTEYRKMYMILERMIAFRKNESRQEVKGRLLEAGPGSGEQRLGLVQLGELMQAKSRDN